MADLSAMVAHLKAERAKSDKAIEALSGAAAIRVVVDAETVGFQQGLVRGRRHSGRLA